ncbi:MAG: hypothetical protein AB7O39_00705 [Flavobacteriaceae bacterium]
MQFEPAALARRGRVRTRVCNTLLAAAMALCGFTSSPATSGSFPGTGYKGDDYFFSADPRDVTVTLLSEGGDPARQFTLPGAYIFHAKGTRGPHDLARGRLFTRRIGLIATFNGQPLSIAAAATRPTSNAALEAVIEAMQPEYYDVFLVSEKRTHDLRERYQKMLSHLIDTRYYQALEMLGGKWSYDSETTSFFGLAQDDEFDLIVCFDKVMHATGGACTYHFFLSAGISARAHFQSPGQLGGRNEVNARIRSIRRHLCRHIGCVDVNERGALLPLPDQKPPKDDLTGSVQHQ